MRQLITRIDDDLHEQLKARAEYEGRSMNGLVTDILREAMAALGSRPGLRERIKRSGLRVIPPQPEQALSRDEAIASTRGAGRAVSEALERARSAR